MNISRRFLILALLLMAGMAAGSNTIPNNSLTFSIIGLPGGLSGSFQIGAYNPYCWGQGNCTASPYAGGIIPFTTSNGVTTVVVSNMVAPSGNIVISGFGATQSSRGDQYLACTSSYAASDCAGYANPGTAVFGGTTIIKYWTYLNITKWNAQQANELIAMGVPANSPIIIGLVGNVTESTTYGNVKLAGNYLAAGVHQYANYTSTNGTLSFVTANILQAIPDYAINIDGVIVHTPGNVLVQVPASYIKNGQYTLSGSLYSNTLGNNQFSYSYSTPSGGGTTTASNITQTVSATSATSKNTTVTFELNSLNANYTSVDPSVTYVATTTYTISTTQSLGTDITNCKDFTINSGITLTSAGHSIICSDEFNNQGTLVTGYNSSEYSAGGWPYDLSMFGVYIQANQIIAGVIDSNAVTAEGGAGGYGNGAYGGNTLSTGGLGGTSGTPNGGNGATPSPPSLSGITGSSTIRSWWLSTLGIQNYLESGPSGFFLYYCGSPYCYKFPNSYGGSGGGGGYTTGGIGGFGGAGGGAILLAYHGLYTAGTYTVNGGAASSGTVGNGGTGGSGQVITFNYPSNDPPIDIMSIPIVTSSPILPVTLDAGQTIVFTASITGGDSPYTYNYFLANTVSGSVVASASYSSSSATNSFSWISYGTNSIEANVVVTDTNGANSITMNSIYIQTLTVYSPALIANTPSISSIPAFPTTQVTGNTITFSASFTGGFPPFTYNYIIANTATLIPLASYLFTSCTLTSNTFTWVIPSPLANNAVYANVVVTDSATTNEIANSINTNILTIIPPYPTPSLSTPVPDNVLLMPGQGVTYNVILTGGIGPFTVNLMNGGTLVSSLTDQYSPNTLTFASNVPAYGLQTFYVVANDLGATPSVYGFRSATNSIYVNIPPTLTIQPALTFISGASGAQAIALPTPSGDGIILYINGVGRIDGLSADRSADIPAHRAVARNLHGYG